MEIHSTIANRVERIGEPAVPPAEEIIVLMNTREEEGDIEAALSFGRVMGLPGDDGVVPSYLRAP